jgi:hypothetical protein
MLPIRDLQLLGRGLNSTGSPTVYPRRPAGTGGAATHAMNDFGRLPPSLTRIA